MNKHIFRLLSVLLFMGLLGMQKVAAQEVDEEPLPAPKLTPAVVKKLGYPGVDFKQKNDATWTLKNGVTVYSSYPYGQEISGFMGPTPVFIAVDKQQKITAVTPSLNRETPEYFLLTKPLFKAWKGKTLQEAKTLVPDAVTRATLSSNAIVQTVQATAKALSK